MGLGLLTLKNQELKAGVPWWGGAGEAVEVVGHQMVWGLADHGEEFGFYSEFIEKPLDYTEH